jgi:hypothetical protein
MSAVSTTVVPFPITNEQFLRAAFGAHWKRALVAAFPGDPENPQEANWTAYPAKMLPSAARQSQLNTYFCPSLVRGTRRALYEFVSFHVIVIDDYGTKVDRGRPEEFLGKPASYILETSPSNFQAGWFIEPRTDLAWVRGFLQSLKLALGAGDNLTDPMTWRRLPVGINGKAKYRDPMGRSWQARLGEDLP